MIIAILPPRYKCGQKIEQILALMGFEALMGLITKLNLEPTLGLGYLQSIKLNLSKADQIICIKTWAFNLFL